MQGMFKNIVKDKEALTINKEALPVPMVCSRSAMIA